jgi:hypothetical protein
MIHGLFHRPAALAAAFAFAGFFRTALAQPPAAAPVTVLRFPSSLDEISGLEQSRTQPGVYWVHNDSGDKPRAYAVHRSGRLLAIYTLAGADAVDWEDMSIGPAPNGGTYLYFADTGDNEAQRASIAIYRVLEPKVPMSTTPAERTLSGITKYEFVFADGARDCESFFVDPKTGDFYFVTKRELDGNRLYVAPAAGLKTSGMNTLAQSATFGFTGATGAAISPDGLQVLVRRYSSSSPFTPSATAATYWRRANTKTSLTELLRQPGTTLALVPEVQGEAIAFRADNRGFYSTGERGSGLTAQDSPLTYYPAPVVK